MRHLWECDDGPCKQRRERTNGGDDRAAVHPIRQPADGVLDSRRPRECFTPTKVATFVVATGSL